MGRLGRAALFAFGATLSAASIGCGESTTPPEDGGGVADASFDSGGPAPAYGAVPVDAGPIDAGPSEVDAGSSGALYGGAPP